MLALIEEVVTLQSLWMVVKAMDIDLSVMVVDMDKDKNFKAIVMAETSSAMTQRNHLILL